MLLASCNGIIRLWISTRLYIWVRYMYKITYGNPYIFMQIDSFRSPFKNRSQLKVKVSTFHFGYLSSSSRVILIVPNSSLTCENRNFKTQSAFDVIIKERFVFKYLSYKALNAIINHPSVYSIWSNNLIYKISKY